MAPPPHGLGDVLRLAVDQAGLLAAHAEQPVLRGELALLAGELVEGRAMPLLMIAVLYGPRDAAQQLGQARLAFHQRHRSQLLAVDEQQIERKEHQRQGVVRFRGRLDHVKGSRAIRADAAEFAIEVRRLDGQL